MTNENKEHLVRIIPASAIICKHCGASIVLTIIEGLSIVCPVCKKPQNGRMKLSPEKLLENA